MTQRSKRRRWLIGTSALVALVVGAAALGLPEPEETGDTFHANARLKARAASDATGLPALADDSGVVVHGLHGQPGIHSARWTDDPIGELLAKLSGRGDRGARYRCVIVALGPDGREIVVAGSLEGRIALEPRGSEGFGYDPIFVPEGEERTVAELGDAWKRRNSHRARAAAALRAALASS